MSDEEYYSLLRGMKIVDTFMVQIDDNIFPCLVIESLMGNRFHMIVSRDPEQNGPGFLYWYEVEEQNHYWDLLFTLNGLFRGSRNGN